MELDVTAMGELLIDFAPRGENEMGYPVLEANPGGAPGNFLAALAAYGARTAMLGKVGDDAFGHLLRETMARAGIETTGIVMDPSVFTTLAFVTLSPEGDRSFSFARKPGADTCLTWEEVDRTLDEIYESGYADSVIIQDFIPGDDSYMRVVTNYSGEDGKVRLMCLGHVLLEEHSRFGIGNHSVIITEYEPELCEKLRVFLEDLQFTGFSNFDVKYDQRDGKFKVFEINCRQGRSNYYVTGAGYNLAKFLVEDRIYHRPQELVVTKNRHLWQVVPMKVITDHVNPAYLEEVRALRKLGAWVNPLLYQADRNPIHKAHILWGQHRYIKWFNLSMGKANARKSAGHFSE